MPFQSFLGFCVNMTKSWLIVKERSLQSALKLFWGNGIQITSVGCPYLVVVLVLNPLLVSLLNSMLVSGFLGCLICHLLLKLSPMLHILPSFMDLFLSETIIFTQTRVFQNSSLLLNQLYALVFYIKLVSHTVSDVEYELFFLSCMPWWTWFM